MLRINANLELLVGGEVLDLAFAQAKPHARFVICGGKFAPTRSAGTHTHFIQLSASIMPLSEVAQR